MKLKDIHDDVVQIEGTKADQEDLLTLVAHAINDVDLPTYASIEDEEAKTVQIRYADGTIEISPNDLRILVMITSALSSLDPQKLKEQGILTRPTGEIMCELEAIQSRLTLE